MGKKDTENIQSRRSSDKKMGTMKYLLIGYGSIGKRHESIIKRYDIHSDITVCTRTKPAGIEYKWIKRQDLEKLDGEVD